MILVRSPLRITFGGGGTDLPSYYKLKEGFLISAAIDKYVYVSILKPFTKGFFLKYSEIEKVLDVNSINHPIIRESLKYICPKEDQIEITTLADIPAGTGLGSSGSFTVGLVKALHNYRKTHINQKDIAKLACEIEINKLNQPIGKQDQYASAIGGLTCFKFKKNDSVTIAPLLISNDTLFHLEDRLLLFFTGFSRSANDILDIQKKHTEANNEEMIKNLDFVKKLGFDSKIALETGDVDCFGQIMHEHWIRKKSRSGNMTNKKIDEVYDIALRNGAIGGKLVGAGGGGFLLFLANDPKKLRNSIKNIGLEEVRFKFDFNGTQTIVNQ